MNNNRSNNIWTVSFILNADGLGSGDAVVTLNPGVNGFGNDDCYEVEVFGDFVDEINTIDEAFFLAEDMVSFYDAMNTVENEIEEEIHELENELSSLDRIGHYLGETFSGILFDFLHEELNVQLEQLEALAKYNYDMFVEDSDAAEEKAIIDMIDEALAVETNGNVRGPFSVI